MTAPRDDDPTDRGVTPADVLAHVCDNGWSLTTLEDQPRPCPRCKPHLARTQRHGFTAWRPNASSTHGGTR